MAKRISKLASSLKQLGDIQVTEWDFMALLNKDIKELEIARSLRRLGNIQVVEWDFRTVLPAVNRLANQEVDLVDFFKRTANYRIIEWDFRGGGSMDEASSPMPRRALPDPEVVQEVTVRLKDFLQYVVVALIDEPGHAQIKVMEIAPGVLRFRLVMVKRDVARLIGTGGHTAAAIRNLLKATAATRGVQVLLQILSHEEEMSVGHAGV